jgi:hypothetical protein
MIQLQGHVYKDTSNDKDKENTGAVARSSRVPHSHAIVSLPTGSSPVLTRELLYTAVTRGKERLTVVASEAALRAAVSHPVARASGLRERLWPVGPEGDA